jgi:hypothetical protein
MLHAAIFQHMNNGLLQRSATKLSIPAWDRSSLGKATVIQHLTLSPISNFMDCNYTFLKWIYRMCYNIVNPSWWYLYFSLLLLWFRLPTLVVLFHH